MPVDFDQKRADDLMKQAFEALDRGKPKAALKIAKALNRVKYSGSFEIQALAHVDLGNPSKAIDVLREGTQTCPGVWSLWQMLGNSLSDAGRFDEAFEAYERGLKADGPFEESLNLNFAIALLRAGQATEARERIGPILRASRFNELEGSLRARMHALELEALRKLNRLDDAIAVFDAIGNEGFGDDAGAELSMLWSEYARAHLELGHRHDAERAALRSVQFNVTNDDALALLREIRRAPANSRTNRYRLLVQGQWIDRSDHTDKNRTGFFTSYMVCADSEEEALGFVAELQPEAATNLRIEEAKLVGKVTEPKGVYSATGRVFFSEEDGE